VGVCFIIPSHNICLLDCLLRSGETPFAIASALQDAMLITDRAAGLVRVFAGLPMGGPPSVFHKLRSEGGFLLSAEWRDNETQWVYVQLDQAAGQLTLDQAARRRHNKREATAALQQLRLAPGLPSGYRAHVMRSDGGATATTVHYHDDGSVSLGLAVGAHESVLLLPSSANASAVRVPVVRPVESEPEYENWWGCVEGRSAGPGLL
jgi:hypothetical protein